MPDQRPQAELVHRTQSRARLRLRIGDDDQPVLDRIARELERLPQVTAIRASSRTHSLLILHQGELEPILERARELVELLPPQSRAPMRRLQRALERANTALGDPSRDSGVLTSMAFFALLGAAAHQTARGKLLPAGMPLIGYALRVMDWAAEREPSLPES